MYNTSINTQQHFFVDIESDQKMGEIKVKVFTQENMWFETSLFVHASHIKEIYFDTFSSLLVTTFSDNEVIISRLDIEPLTKSISIRRVLQTQKKNGYTLVKGLRKHRIYFYKHVQTTLRNETSRETRFLEIDILTKEKRTLLIPEFVDPRSSSENGILVIKKESSNRLEIFFVDEE